MAFERITDGDMLGKGNLGRPDTPGVDTAEMQRILDELPREVIVPAFNRLAQQLEAVSAASELGAQAPESLPEGTPATVQGVLEAVLARAEKHMARADNPHAVTAAQTGAYTKEETDAAIGQRVVEIGAGDMARAVYDPAGEKRDVFAAIREGVAGAGHMEKSVYAAKGEPGAVDRALTADAALTAAAAEDGVKVYTHSKSGTVHEFTGKGANGRALLTADVEAGDTFTVNGQPAAAYLGTEDAARAMAGSPWNGRWVSFVFDGETLNFKGGDGLTAADKAKLIPENIRTGTTLFEGTQREVAGQANAFCLFAQGRTNPSVFQVYCNAEATKYTNASGDISATDGSPLLTINRSGRYRAQIGIAPYQFSGSSGARLLKNGEVIGSVFPVGQYDSGYFDFEAEQGDVLTWQIYSWSGSAYAYCFMPVWQIG